VAYSLLADVQFCELECALVTGVLVSTAAVVPWSHHHCFWPSSSLR